MSKLLRSAVDNAVKQDAHFIEGYPFDMENHRLTGQTLKGYLGSMGIASIFRCRLEITNSPAKGWYTGGVTNLSLYIHIPFCAHRCCYCDFNTYAGLEELIPEYIQALCIELDHLAASSNGPLSFHTVYFGGGTPSLLPIVEIERVLNHLALKFALDGAAEITIEANPGTLTPPYLVDLKRTGVNRISLGLQSASPEQLRFLERQHTAYDTIEAVKWVRQAGFDNLNLDLIFGLPGQLLDGWLDSLRLALGLGPEHLSLYSLTIEKSTPLYNWYQRGLVPLADDDLTADQYEAASKQLAERGYAQYEISNWALHRDGGSNYACRHNLQYWRGLPYLGVGAGAHGYFAHMRIANVLSPLAYIQRLMDAGNQKAAESTLDKPGRSFPVTPAAVEVQQLDPTTEIGEFMFMGLRLVNEGISRKNFQERFGIALEQAYPDSLQHLFDSGLIEWAGRDAERLRLTTRGRFLSNQVFVEFI